MEDALQRIYQSLQKLVGLHRQLLDTVRMEREALASADLKGIEESTRAKEAIIAAIIKEEAERVKYTTALALILKKSLEELTLPKMIIELQTLNAKMSEQLRSAFNALTILIQRIREQNDSNRDFVETSLEHVRNMKNNVLGERAPRSDTYSKSGQRMSHRGAMGSRLVSREA